MLKPRLAKGILLLCRRFLPSSAFVPEATATELTIIDEVKPFTMTSPERLLGLMTAIRYLVANEIRGDIVECGVWKGGSMMAAAKTLIGLNQQDRHIYLFDTFAGMTPPTDKDTTQFESKSATASYLAAMRSNGICAWSYSSLEETRRNLETTGYPSEKLHFVKGKVEQNLPEHAPKEIALLRLDTDFFESTKHELEHLFPRLVQGGVLILDDYGHWEGQKLAVDDYIRRYKIKLLLNRLDYTGRIAVKH